MISEGWLLDNSQILWVLWGDGGCGRVPIKDKGFGRSWGDRWQFTHSNEKLRSSSMGNVCRVFKKSLKHLAKPLNFSNLVIPLWGIQPKKIILQGE